MCVPPENPVISFSRGLSTFPKMLRDSARTQYIAQVLRAVNGLLPKPQPVLTGAVTGAGSSISLLFRVKMWEKDKK